MSDCKILQAAMLAGEIMLTSGAETYRVEDTMMRMLAKSDADTAESFVIPTGLFASLGGGKDILTMVRRIKNRTTNFEKISLVNDLSRSFVDGKLTAADALVRLQSIDALPPCSNIRRVLATASGCCFFAGMFLAGPQDMLCSFVIGIVLAGLQIFLGNKNVSVFLVNLFGGMLISILALAFVQIGAVNDLHKVIIGAIMPMLPGVALTNAIRDTIAGDMLSGTTRLVDAILMAIAIASGVGIILSLFISYL